MQQLTIPNWESPNQTTLERGRGYDPYAHADALGIQVLVRPIRTANELWLPDYDTIVLKSGMRAAHMRGALAHGIGHAVLAHEDDRPKHEHQADRYAADNLIDLEECIDVMKWAPDCQKLANELGVTLRLMRAYLESHRLAA